ncbi:hypothetical protein [Roseibacillus ishigakijimensis]|uniref:DUF2017 domain-containing protein n=1 Tax=Roseibacillus ishigakijimensis TaxID=454146 RepID=A0A934RQM4_9BACT|nr:hypothetical protein [Roseibacillus ishigakijimensis]MBK1832470.1 hypothetical protein [Roseibacillus ishigakijimensis]
MTILSDKEGSLVMQISAEEDWRLFTHLLADARGQKPDWLAKRFGVLMDDEDWDELIAPELSARFQKEIEEVEEMVKAAYEDYQKQLAAEEKGLLKEEVESAEEELPFGEISFNRETSSAWYSVLNQARLFLEGRWKLAALEEAEEITAEDVDPDRMGAYIRSRFYTRLQALLLDFTLEL